MACVEASGGGGGSGPGVGDADGKYGDVKEGMSSSAKISSPKITSDANH